MKGKRDTTPNMHEMMNNKAYGKRKIRKNNKDQE
jgi:hypothetical protein